MIETVLLVALRVGQSLGGSLFARPDQAGSVVHVAGEFGPGDQSGSETRGWALRQCQEILDVGVRMFV